MCMKRTKKVQQNVKRKFVLSAGFDKLRLCDLIGNHNLFKPLDHVGIPYLRQKVMK